VLAMPWGTVDAHFGKVVKQRLLDSASETRWTSRAYLDILYVLICKQTRPQITYKIYDEDDWMSNKR